MDPDPTAVMGRRVAAYLIDAALGLIVSVIAFILLADSRSDPGDPCGDDAAPTLCFHVDGTTYFAAGSSGAWVVIVSFGFWLVMGAVIQGLAGGTPGKLILGLRVVDRTSGSLAGIPKCLGRTLLWVVDAQPFGFPLVGLVASFTTKGHRRLGDMAARTLVVGRQWVGTPPTVPGLTTTASSHPPPAGPPVATATGDGIDAPKWDPDRGAYIQWDVENQQWMIYDDAASQWRPLS